ncbi:hypothetical protein Emag_000789 [Eimeria magna]
MLPFGCLGRAAALTRCLPSTPLNAAAAAVVAAVGLSSPAGAGCHAITAAAAGAAAAAAAARPPVSRRHLPCLGSPSFAFRCFSVSSHISSSSNSNNNHSSSSSSSSSSDVVRQFSSVDLKRAASGSSPHRIMNLVGGRWLSAAKTYNVISPLTGRLIALAPLTQASQLLAS